MTQEILHESFNIKTGDGFEYTLTIGTRVKRISGKRGLSEQIGIIKNFRTTDHPCEFDALVAWDEEKTRWISTHRLIAVDAKKWK